jgi:ABC-2 type transport system permease protein
MSNPVVVTQSTPSGPEVRTGSASGPRGVAGLARDTVIVMTRELRPVLRDPFSLIFGMLQPLVFLALFGPLLVGSLGGEANNALGESVWQWFVPSILVMTALFGTTTVGANLLYEFHTGAHERMLVTPLSRPSLLIGRALKEMVPLAGQAVIIVLVMIPFGFVLYPAGALLGLALLAVFGVGLGSLSYALAIAVRKQEWMFWAVQQTLIFPLMILSGMLLPLETGPEWMQLVAKFNPLAYIVDAERALFGGQIATSAAMWGAVAAIGTAIVGLWVGISAMRRSAD